MKALLCKTHGGPDALVYEDAAAPKAGKGQVTIEVHSAGVNFLDTLIIAGKYQDRPPLPFAPGVETGGIVVEVGKGVTGFAVGDHVTAHHRIGGFAEYVTCDVQTVYKIPDDMPFDQAAGFSLTYGTSYHALVDRAALTQGETLLVHGAAGGVGLTAVEIGTRLGARVIGTVGSDEKTAIVRDYGADHVINYTKEDFRDAIKELTDGAGVDIVYDPVGGDVFDRSLSCIAFGARLLVIGFASGRIPALKTNLTLLKGCSILGVYWGEWASRYPKKNRQNFDTMLKWVATGKLRPHVSLHFPLERGAEALKALMSRVSTGKVVIDVKS